MENKNFIKAQKDHFHFTNICWQCRKIKDDSQMVPIWAERNGYLEPDYICELCSKMEKIRE